MNPRRMIVASVILGVAALVPWASATEQPCGTAVVRSEVEIAAGELSLGDLLEPGACPALLLAAREMRLGTAPLAGSVRVFEGNQVRALFDKLENQKLEVAGLSRSPSGSWNVPERITVRRTGRSASCADLAEQILATLPSPAAGERSMRTVDCGAAARISQDAPLELSPAMWNPGRAAWEISARCKHPADCVPFLVRVRESRRSPATAESARRASSTSAAGSSPSRASGAAQFVDELPLVHPGETATLVWDQDGIRLLVPVLCLDRGSLGRPVRARILPGGRVIQAIVVSAGKLRIIS